MAGRSRIFDSQTFLSTVGVGREMMSFRKGQGIFAQGDPSDAVFVIQTGSVRLSARAHGGKEATLDILGDEDIIGKDSIAGHSVRTVSAEAWIDCRLLRIEKKVMMMALAGDMALAKAFGAYVLARSLRYQQDLVDQRCNCAEKRLAGTLLRLSDFEEHGTPSQSSPA